MKNGKKVAWILVSVCFLSMIALVIIYVNSSPPVEDGRILRRIQSGIIHLLTM